MESFYLMKRRDDGRKAYITEIGTFGAKVLTVNHSERKALALPMSREFASAVLSELRRNRMVSQFGLCEYELVAQSGRSPRYVPDPPRPSIGRTFRVGDKVICNGNPEGYIKEDVLATERRASAYLNMDLVRATGKGEHHCRWCGKRSWDGETRSEDRHDPDCPIFTMHAMEQERG